MEGSPCPSSGAADHLPVLLSVAALLSSAVLELSGLEFLCSRVEGSRACLQGHTAHINIVNQSNRHPGGWYKNVIANRQASCHSAIVLLPDAHPT